MSAITPGEYRGAIPETFVILLDEADKVIGNLATNQPALPPPITEAALIPGAASDGE